MSKKKETYNAAKTLATMALLGQMSAALNPLPEPVAEQAKVSGKKAKKSPEERHANMERARQEQIAARERKAERAQVRSEAAPPKRTKEEKEAEQESRRAEAERLEMEGAERRQREEARLVELANKEIALQERLGKEREARRKADQERKNLSAHKKKFKPVFEEIKAKGLAAAQKAKEEKATKIIAKAIHKLKSVSSEEVRIAKRIRVYGNSAKREVITDETLRDCILAIVNASSFEKMEKKISQYKTTFKSIFGMDVDKYLATPTPSDDEPTREDKMKYIGFVIGAAGLIKRCSVGNLNKEKLATLSASSNQLIDQAFDDAQLKPFNLRERVIVRAKLFIRSIFPMNIFPEVAKYHEDRTNGEIFSAAMTAIDAIEKVPLRNVQSDRVLPDVHNRHHHQSMNMGLIGRV